ncbi:MAG: hypothetical protein IPP46_15130 [Bacteroidetes bacterium]|nr:hypothetical protein [Bacteroidota bacterium]
MIIDSSLDSHAGSFADEREVIRMNNGHPSAGSVLAPTGPLRAPMVF